MGDARAAPEFDRLPWLADEPKPAARSRSGVLILMAVAGALIIAAASYWLGRTTSSLPQAQHRAHRSATMPLPEARPVEPEVKLDRIPEVRPAIVPTVQPTPQREVPLRRPSLRPAPKVSNVKAAPKPVAPASRPAVRRQADPLTLWPSTTSAGAAGRMVQIGAFGTRYQAKRGWWAMVRAYPALKSLPTVVTDARNSQGRRFYRLQIGTTSQAHSEVLCQRMQKIRYSCAVVGLPWRPKGVER